MYRPKMKFKNFVQRYFYKFWALSIQLHIQYSIVEITESVESREKTGFNRASHILFIDYLQVLTPK